MSDFSSGFWTFFIATATLAGIAGCAWLLLAMSKRRAPADADKTGQRIANDLQTNGTLLDGDWARFLKRHRFLVGLSCDGPQRLHDLYRTTKGGTPTHDKVVAA